MGKFVWQHLTMKTFALLVFLAIFCQAQAQDQSIKKECRQFNVFYQGFSNHYPQAENYKQCEKLCKSMTGYHKCKGWTFWPWNSSTRHTNDCEIFFYDFTAKSIDDDTNAVDYTGKTMIAKFCGTVSGTLAEC